MALSLGQTGTADPIEAEYFTWEEDGSPLTVHMHLDAVDGIARDVVEGFKSLPRRGVEVGGLLLGRVEPGERTVVWIDRYQRIECHHRYGPRFVLDEEEVQTLERAATSIAEGGELNVIGFYRSDTRAGFQLEAPDFELFSRYFGDPSDMILLIKPENMTDISAQFFTPGATGQVQSSGATFPFRGRVVGSLSGEGSGETALPEGRTEPLFPPASPEADAAQQPPREFRRLVPDFAPPGHSEEPRHSAREFLRDPETNSPSRLSDEPEPSAAAVLFRKWWPLLGAMLLVGGAIWLLLPRGERRDNAPVQGSGESVSIRPLGLYVDPSGPTWRVSWNAGATALRGARGVDLFVRDGDDQNRIDLSPQDLQSATYQYPAKGRDVTFRLEVTDSGGHLSAESFRVMKESSSGNASPARSGLPAAPRNDTKIDPKNATTPPRAVHKVPPVIPASIRPRIDGTIPIDVRVAIDARGRVTAAAPVKKHHSGLESYLAERAVAAARLWRFEPAREEGKPVPGKDTIHFVFEH